MYATEVKRSVIYYDGQLVTCYGEWYEDSNCYCLFDDEELDGYFTEGASSWEEAVRILGDYAKKHKTTVIELTAC